jgi:hypothetical protein
MVHHRGMEKVLIGFAGFGNEPSAQEEESRILRLRGGLVPRHRISITGLGGE